MLARSIPAENPRPAPVSRIARWPSVGARLSVEARAPSISGVNAFRTSGRLRVMTATPSRASYRMGDSATEHLTGTVLPSYARPRAPDVSGLRARDSPGGAVHRDDLARLQ